MSTSLYSTVGSPGDVSAKNYTSLYSDSLTPGPNPSGDVTIQGNLTVRGGNIYTTATTASIFPTNATTVHAFTAATQVVIGATTGFTNINNELAVNGNFIQLRANSTGTPPPAPAGEGGMIIHRGSTGQDAFIIWAETGTYSTGYWDLSNDARVRGDLTVEDLLFVEGNQIIGNSTQTSFPIADFYLTARRGTSPDTSIRWNESTDTWQFSNDGSTYYDMVTGGSGGSATFGNITIAVETANTISTNTGALVLNSATNQVSVTADLTAENLYGVNSVVSYGQLGSNGKTLLLNFDNGTDTNDGFFQINRGGTGSAVSLKWNETTDRWEFTNNGSTFYNMVIALDDLNDVVIATPTTGQLLTYNGTNWVNDNNITATSSAQTINQIRSGAFSADTAGTLRAAARYTKKFTDVGGTPSDQGGPTLLFNVQNSLGTNTSYAGITSNYNSGGSNSVSVVTSTDNFATTQEAVNITYAQTSFPGNVAVTGLVSTTAVIIDSRIQKNTGTATYTSTSQQVFGSIPIATYRTVKNTWQISRGTEFQALETLITHDGTTAYITAYSDVRTGANLAAIDADISGGNIRILVTPTSTASTVLVADYTLFYN